MTNIRINNTPYNAFGKTLKEKKYINGQKDLECLEAIAANLLVHETVNHKLRIATPSMPADGVNAEDVSLGAGVCGTIIKQGYGRGKSYASLKSGKIKTGLAGKLANFIEVLDGDRVILAAVNGNDGGITAKEGSNLQLTAVSDDTADITQRVTIYGTQKTTGTAIKETLMLNGTTAATTSYYFDEVYGAELSASCAGSIVIATTAPVTNITITTGNTTAGLDNITGMAQYNSHGGKVQMTIDLLEAVELIIVGEAYDRTEILEKIVWTAADEALVKETVALFYRVTKLINGDHAAAQTLALAGLSSNDIVTDFVNNEDSLTTSDAADKGGDAAIIVKSDSALDLTQKVTIAWKNAGGTFSCTEKTLNGTSDVAVGSGDTVLGAWLDSETAGDVIVDYNTGTVVLQWDGSATLGGGMLTQEDGDVAYAALDIAGNLSPVTLSCSNTSAADIICVQGLDAAGSAQIEGVTLSSGVIATSGSWSEINHIYCAGTEDTEYFKISNETADDGSKCIGKAFEGATAGDTVVEIELRLP